MKKAYVNLIKNYDPDRIINESDVSDDNIEYIYNVVSGAFKTEINEFKRMCENNMHFELDFEDLYVENCDKDKFLEKLDDYISIFEKHEVVIHIPETTIPFTTMTETTIPITTIPETTTPITTMPETTIPIIAMPETIVPITTIPETIIQITTIPETTIPITIIPETTDPITTIPKTTIPITTIPETTISITTMSETTISVSTSQIVPTSLTTYISTQVIGNVSNGTLFIEKVVVAYPQELFVELLFPVCCIARYSRCCCFF